MAGKSALPIIALAGAAATALLLSKKKTKKVLTKSDEQKNGESNIVLSGSDLGWGWRVRKSASLPGFSDRYFGEVQATESSDWMKVHDEGRKNPEEARNLALEFIANA